MYDKIYAHLFAKMESAQVLGASCSTKDRLEEHGSFQRDLMFHANGREGNDSRKSSPPPGMPALMEATQR